MTEKILIIDFGSQYTQLIARRVREMQVYCEIYPFNNVPALDETVRGVILSGSEIRNVIKKQVYKKTNEIVITKTFV